MSGPEGLAAFMLVLLAGPVSFSPCADLSLPDEPKAAGVVLLPGRLPWGATALPSGEILAACEDQTLSVLDDKAAIVSQWKAPARFSAVLTVGPPGPLTLTAVPMVTGRVEILGWDGQTRTLASQFAVTHQAEATATAWGSAGTVTLGWKDGHVESWTSSGTLRWTFNLGSEVLWLLADDGLGVYAFSPDRVILLDQQGKKTEEWSLAGRPLGVLQTLAGNLYVWTTSGLWAKGPSDQKFALLDTSAQLLGVVVDRQGRLVLTEPHRLRRIAPNGTALSAVTLPRTALTASVLDDRGRVLVGTDGGLEVWTYDGRFLGFLDTTAPASAPLLTDRGLGVWSDSRWRVHLWTGFRWPVFGWPQEGGGPGRPFSARGPSSVSARAVTWADNLQFGYFYQLASSGEEAKQSQVLDLFEAKTPGTLLPTWPFANVILLKVARSGLTDLLLDRGRITNNWPGLRLRAFALLAQSASPEDREELVDLLHREFDPSVAAQGARALAQSGWDGDGKLMRELYELQERMADQPLVADAVIDAARTLWQVNGRSTDPVLISLVSEIYQGPYSRSVKLKAQKFFQDLVEAP